MIDDFIVFVCEGLWDVVFDDDIYWFVKSCFYGELLDGLEFLLNIISCIFFIKEFCFWNVYVYVDLR